MCLRMFLLCSKLINSFPVSTISRSRHLTFERIDKASRRRPKLSSHLLVRRLYGATTKPTATIPLGKSELEFEHDPTVAAAVVVGPNKRTTGSRREQKGIFPIESSRIECTYLFQMSFGSAEKDDGEITSGCGCHGRQQDVVHGADGPLDDWFATAQRRVDIQTAKVFSNRLQFLQETRETKSIKSRTTSM